MTAEADVIVVGSGAAALAAAVAARDAGSEVTVLERSAFLGGTTAVSGGGIWMPQNHHQAAAGIEDSREEALAYCRSLAGDSELLDTFIDRGPGILRGLEDTTPLQLRLMSWPDYHPEMEGAKSKGRMLEPALHPRRALGNLRRPPVLGLPMTMQESTVDWSPSYTPERFDREAIGARTTQGLLACGQALVAALAEACLSRGVTFRTKARVTDLISRDDAVVGVATKTETLSARSVVLATGGFEWNPGLRDRFLGRPLTMPASPPDNEGDGLVMAMALGADLGNMTEAWWYPAAIVPGEEYEGRQLSRFVATERSAPHSIIVNRFGQRFVNEAANYNDMQKAFVHFDANRYANRNLPCWVVCDHQYRARYPLLTARPGGTDPPWLLVGGTVDELAAKAGIDGEGLRSTLERWNRQVGAGHDADFGRGDSFYDRFHGDPTAPHPTLGTIQEPPFYALEVHPGSVGTKGGPRINGRGQVMHVKDRPIPGLYGAGNVIASPAGPAYFGGGTSIAMALVWGSISGTSAAAR